MGAGEGRDGHGDAGQGLLGAVFGVLVFLFFLLFAAQLLTALFARSVVSGAAFDAARTIARQPDDLDAAEAEAARVIDQELGRMTVLARSVTYEPDATDPDFVVFTVRAAGPGLVSGFLDRDIERTARVRVEKLQ